MRAEVKRSVSTCMFFIDNMCQICPYIALMKRILSTAFFALLGCLPNLYAGTTVDFYNTWGVYDEESGEEIGITISNAFRECASMTFILTDMPEYGYQVDINMDDEDEPSSPTHYKLSMFTLVSCNAVADTKLWGVLTDGTGTIVAASRTTTTGVGEAVEFDFTGDSPVLQAATSYSIYFVDDKVVGDNAPAIGQTISLPLSKLGVAWTTDGWYDELENTWIRSYPESVELSYGDNEGDSDGNAPAIYISTEIVPEPTTATLSLLALAGLTIRRRRG